MPPTTGNVKGASAVEEMPTSEEFSGSTETNAKDEVWYLQAVLSSSNISDEDARHCDTTGCELLSCSVWVSNFNSSSPWYSCVNCQEADFRGWPVDTASLDAPCYNIIVSKCSSISNPKMPSKLASSGRKNSSITPNHQDTSAVTRSRKRSNAEAKKQDSIHEKKCPVINIHFTLLTCLSRQILQCKLNNICYSHCALCELNSAINLLLHPKLNLKLAAWEGRQCEPIIGDIGNFLVSTGEPRGNLQKKRKGKRKSGGGVRKVKNSVIRADIDITMEIEGGSLKFIASITLYFVCFAW